MRQTIRRYSSRPVSESLLQSLLEEAARAQTMGNLQLYSVVVTRDAEMKQQLAPFHFNQPMVTNAPVVLTFCADYHRTTEWALQRKGHPGYGNFLSYQNAAIDALLFCQRFCDLAESLGLGMCFLGTTVYKPLEIIRLLRLPKLVMPVATLTLGWPDEHPAPGLSIPDQKTFADNANGFRDIAEWRRYNVNSFIERIYETVQFIQFRWHRIQFRLDQCTGLIYKIDCLIRQETIRNITV